MSYTEPVFDFSVSRDFTPITHPIVGQGSLLAVNPAVPTISEAGLPGFQKDFQDDVKRWAAIVRRARIVPE